MAKSKRNILAAAQETLTPPEELTESQSIARVLQVEGNNLYICELPNTKTIVVELQSRFRGTIFIKRGGYVLVDLASAAERPAASRVVGEIINIVRDEKAWRKQAYWPKKFEKKTYDDDSDSEEESNVGKMPPSDSEDEDER
ncbi:hypothetical protein QC763_608490 [Podospora pseudopauciseta]|uniref:S1-like domain-containing protein n=2 Tax=Podospora TaxID=5144 RepID=A0ABR0H5X5_9PEZI|nr:hypothetical protein QC763_608490 [Podospora pseudopauciseta]KAK4671760.1 hypothetical protein QC764_608490 [Podospora pseudoanserina]